MENINLKDNTLYIIGNLTIKEIPDIIANFQKLSKKSFDKIDLKNLESMDGAGVAFIEDVLASSKLDKNSLINVADNFARTLEVFSSQSIKQASAPNKMSYFESLGDKTYTFLNELYEGIILASDAIWYSIAGIFNPKGRRKGSVTEQAILIGLDALPIITLLSFVIGFILTLQSGFQLQKFGANVYIADLLGISIVREMGPLITAIIIAGRSGSAIASEIATMKVTEEIDALKMMALNPIKYVIVPKFHAITYTMPILVAYSVIISLGAGLLISVGMLDVALEVYINRIVNILAMKDIFLSLAKSICFAWLIVVIGSYFGMKVRGGAEGVGKATTSSVVASIFAVILADAAFSLAYL